MMTTHDVLVMLSSTLLFALKVNIAASVDMTVFLKRLDRKSGMAIGVACQFVILPFCGFCIARILDLEPVYGMALMVMMTSPGGSFSNWWCSVFNADLAMSVAMTGVSTVAGVVMLPLNLTLYCILLYGEGSFTGDQFLHIFVNLMLILLALFIGLATSYVMDSEKARDRFVVAANIVGVLLFLLSLFVSEHKSRSPAWQKPGMLHIALATPIVSAIIATITVTSTPALQMSKPERVAVVIEACYQNPGLATSIIIGMFNGRDTGDAVAVPILYGIYEAVLLGMFCLVAHYAHWTFADPNKVGLLEAIGTNYQSLACADAHVDTHVPHQPGHEALVCEPEVSDVGLTAVE